MGRVRAGVLAVLAEPELRAELDRVAAAAGVRVVHASDASPVSRKSWAAAAAVVLDARAAARCGRWALPRRDHVSVLTVAEPETATWAAAVGVGAEQVLRLPEQEADLVRALAEAAESSRDDGSRGHAVAVIGGCGGAGASLFAVALAQAATDALLVDLDPWGGGIDLLLGGETTPGLRWPDLALQGGRLNWSAVRDALPRHRGVSVLSGTAARLRAGRRAGGRRHRRRPARRRSASSATCPSSHRRHPSRAGRRRSGGRRQSLRRPGVRGDRGDGSGPGVDQSQCRAGGAGAVARGIAGGRGRRYRRPAAAGGDQSAAATRRADRARRPAAGATLRARGGGAPGARRAAGRRRAAPGRTARRRERFADRTCPRATGRRGRPVAARRGGRRDPRRVRWDARRHRGAGQSAGAADRAHRCRHP